MDVDVQVSDELEQERKVPWAIIPGIAWVVEKQRKTSVRMSHFCQDEPLLSGWATSVKMSHFCQDEPLLSGWATSVRMSHFCQDEPLLSGWATSVRMSHFCQDEPLSVRMSHFRSEIWISEHPNAKREFSSLDREVKWENIGWCIFLFRSCALASLVVCFVGVTFLYLGLSL